MSDIFMNGTVQGGVNTNEVYYHRDLYISLETGYISIREVIVHSHIHAASDAQQGHFFQIALVLCGTKGFKLTI